MTQMIDGRWGDRGNIMQITTILIDYQLNGQSRGTGSKLNQCPLLRGVWRRFCDNLAVVF